MWFETHGLCVTAAVIYQLSYEDPHTLGAGQFGKFILTRERNETQNEDGVNRGNTNLKIKNSYFRSSNHFHFIFHFFHGLRWT